MQCHSTSETTNCFAALVGVEDRASLVASSDVVLLPKPQVADLKGMKKGGILWGWPHCVQQAEITQAAIDRKLTLLAWEAMFSWKNGTQDMHAFNRNNEMAGYCAVIHALGLTGVDGHYGQPASARILSHGSVSRGAIFALLGRGFGDIRVYTLRPPWAVHDKILGCKYGQVVKNGLRSLDVVEEDGSRRPLLDALAEANVIVNGTLQDTDRPTLFLQPGEESRLAPATLIVDVSCDLAMGFPFARPTSFESPTFSIGPATYYGVDHTPTYLWRSASWELSRVVVAFIERVMQGTGSVARLRNASTCHRDSGRGDSERQDQAIPGAGRPLAPLRVIVKWRKQLPTTGRLPSNRNWATLGWAPPDPTCAPPPRAPPPVLFPTRRSARRWDRGTRKPRLATPPRPSVAGQAKHEWSVSSRLVGARRQCLVQRGIAA